MAVRPGLREETPPWHRSCSFPLRRPTQTEEGGRGMRIRILLAVFVAACVLPHSTTLSPPTREGTFINASKDATWSALLGVWSENAGTLGIITHTDPQLGLLLASLSRSAGRSVAVDMPSWGTCRSVTWTTQNPDSMTWTVVVEGTGESSRIRSEALFWNPGEDCVSHGVREAELESLVRTVAEGRAVGGPTPDPQFRPR